MSREGTRASDWRFGDEITANRAAMDAPGARTAAGNNCAAVDRDRLDELERRSAMDHALITELQTEVLLNREHVANLEDALRTSRRIGAAIGMVMAERKVSEEEAFEILRRVSMDNNSKLRTVAEVVVATGGLGRIGSPPDRA